MAKKRRKPSSRPRTPAPSRATVRTAERDGPTEAEPRLPRAGSRAAARPQPETSRAPEQAPQRTRSEKKELARRQREEIRRRVQRAQRMRQLAWIVGVSGVIAVAVFLFTRPGEPAARPGTLPGELTTEAPWLANADQAAARAEAIDLPPVGDTMHTHADVQILVHGEPVAVPVGIGIDGSDHQSLHTHTDDGVVHMESSVVRDFTLGELFDVWGVRLSGTCLGGYCEDADNTLRVFKDGEEVTGPIRDVVLDDLSVVVVTYGTPDEVPDPIPTFDFSSLQP